MKLVMQSWRSYLEENEEESKFDKHVENTFEKIAKIFGKKLEQETKEISRKTKEETGKIDESNLNESVLFTLGVTLAAPAIVKMFTGIAKIFGNSIKGWTGKDLGIEKIAEKINSYADRVHHSFHTPINFFVRKVLRIKDEAKAKQATELLFHLLVAFLMVYSGVGAAKAASAGETGLASFESLLTAVKAGEVRAFLVASLKQIAGAMD